MNKKTPLTDWHVRNGAQMGVFGGYDMPLWYPAGAKQEHLSVLVSAGLFDTSHLATLAVSGPDAFDLLQLCFSKDLSTCGPGGKGPLPPGRSIYGVFLNPNGHVIDDAIVFRLAEDEFLVVVNVGMGPVVARHLVENMGSREVRISDFSDQVGKIDIQGPGSAKVLWRVLQNPAQAFEKLSYFSFKGHFEPTSPRSAAVRLEDGTPILLSRTGFTGEFGFELFVQPAHLLQLWEALLDAGREFDLTPCGLAARDSLRAGAVLPLSHQDIGAWPFANNPWIFVLPYKPDRTGFTKNFIGAEALLQLTGAEHTYPFVGGDTRKVSIGDPAIVLDENGKTIGRVLTCVTDMGIGRHGGRIYSAASPDKPSGFEPKGLSCGFLRVTPELNPGDAVKIKDSRRTLGAVIVQDIRPDRTTRRPIAEMI
jgi:aminomethyltransferase